MESAAEASTTASTDASSAPEELADEFTEDPPDDGGAWVLAQQAPLPPAPFRVPGDSVVTRLLCATAHLKGGFADHLLAELVEPTHRAMSPNWNLDPIALVRHAAQARSRRSGRDLQLLLVFAAAFATVEIALGAMLTSRLSPTAFGEVVLLTLPLAWLAAFAIVWSHYSLIHRSSLAVIGLPNVPAEEPDGLAQDVEERLDETRHANVVIFSGASPFVGSGDLIDRWSLTVDIGTGVEGEEGKRETPEPFDTAELHDALLAAIPEAMSPKPRSGHRLYVVGGHALTVGGLFRQGPVVDDLETAIRFRRPVSMIPDEVIRRYLGTPHQSARPYSFFELTAWDGQVVVTMFLRVVVTYPQLFAEVAVCALRPPQGRYGDVATIRLGPGAHRWPIFRSVAPATLPLLFFAPRRAWQGYRGGRIDHVNRRELELTLEQRNDVNFSAGAGLREEVARGTNPLHFGSVDEEMFYRSFNRAALDSLQEWLIERRIDVVEFSRQRTNIEDKIQTISINTYGGGSG